MMAKQVGEATRVDPPARFDTALEAMRQEAGRRYAAAVDELLASYIDLAAIEGAMPEGTGVELRTFAAHFALADGLGPLRHREFVTRFPKDLRAVIKARRSALATSG